MYASLQHYFSVLHQLTIKEIKIRYKHNVIGYLWSLANPLCFATIYYLAFKIIMRVPIENYTLFLLCGLFPWQWINSGIMGATSSFLGNAQLLKKVAFSRECLPMSIVLMEAFHFIVSIVVIFGVLSFYDMPLYWSFIWLLPLMLFIQFLWISGLGLLFGSLNVFLRDIERLLSLFLIVIFYASPIVYPAKQVPNEYYWIIKYNPFSYYLAAWRELFIHGTISTDSLYVMSACSALSVAFGYFVYNRLQLRFVEVL